VPSNRHFGRIEDPRETEKFVSRLMRPLFGLAAAPIRDNGKGKDVFLWLAEKLVLGKWLDPFAQTIGDCTSQAVAGALNTLRCVRIAYQGKQEDFVDTATEPIYGGARVEIGRNQVRNDGAVNAWCIQFIREYGILARKLYSFPGYPDLDLTKYSGKLARELGSKGVPDHLEPIAREYPLREASLITSYEQARDAIAVAKCPIVLSSNIGFDPFVRDKSGFIRPGGIWPHAQYAYGVTDNAKRPGLAIKNSWGKNAPTGPRRVILPHGLELDLPDGVYFADAEVCDKIFREQDSFVLNDMAGYPARPFEFRAY
jgi:hypothetical protein